MDASLLYQHQLPWKWQHCDVCWYRMNGLFYACGKCNFKVDIECACMTDTIHHAGHPQHLLEHVAQPDLKRDAKSWRFMCAAGCGYVIDNVCYRCCNNSCDFMVHVRCAVLPASVSSLRWDERHPLMLTYDATLNRPGDFYCDQCETRMNPKRWMYRCRACDLSFHPRCFKTVSGLWRHMKLGQKYVNEAAHRHRLTYQLLTKKRRCDICGCNKFECDGFYCASCNFFICLDDCGAKMIGAGDMKAVD
ncbi:uncharacterized protein LOC125208327 [Salvia hispanica]|uniref:uncharacterized protein LOC125208327 n=1 Tax=Salvia hispanica TaxID=49212 RepID=UPI002009D8D0|nr:uncharacterized protein LOC125208327 [Salvia hispanica]